MSFIVTPAGASAVTFSDITTAWYTTAGQYWQTTPRLSPWKYKILTQMSPNAPGRFVKRFGKDTRLIDRIVVHYVKTSIANVLAAYDADVAAVMNVRCTLTLPGRASTIPNAECVEFKMVPSGRGIMIQKISASIFRAQCMMTFEQLRE